MQQSIGALREDVGKREQALRSITGKVWFWLWFFGVVTVFNRCVVVQAVLNGIDSIQKVLQYFRDNRKHADIVNGYFGTLIENFEVEKTFFTAVEVTAGGR